MGRALTRHRAIATTTAGVLTLALLAASGCGPEQSTAEAGTARAAATAPYDWLQYNGDAAHSGNDTAETLITRQNVGTLRQQFQVTLPARPDGAPVVLTGVTTAGGLRDLVFVLTTAGHLVALDAATGATVWSVQNGPGSCRINNGSSVCYTTSSPAIDPNRQWVYAYGLEGRVHKYAVATGAEVTTGGWPELVTNKPWDEKLSPALVFATDASGTTWLYAANGGYPGDAGDYQGHLTAINLATGAQNVFNTLCSNQTVHFVASPGTPDCAQKQSAVWARSTVVYSSATDRIYAVTGNGDFAPSAFDWADTVFALHPDGTGAGGAPLDSWTPTNFAALNSADLDLGSTAPAILPTSGTRFPHIAVQGGKDATLRILDLDDLSGQGGPGHTGGELFTLAVPQGGQVLTAPAVWVNPADASTWVFVSNGSGISGLSLSVDASGNPSLVSRWRNSAGGFSPLVANGVLYYASSGTLRALDPTTGAQLFAGAIGSIHWQSPVVANGVVYIEDQSSHLTAFSLPTAPTPDFALSATPSTVGVTQGASATSTITVTGTNGFTGSVALSATGLPSGVTATFTPASTTGTSTLTLTASSTATTGPATVTITGASGTLTHTTTVNLTVSAATGTPDFALSVSPSTVTLPRSARRTATVTITRTGGFTGSVRLSLSGVPSGVFAFVSPSTTTGSSATISFFTFSRVAPGSYSVTVRGTSGTLTHTAPVTLTVASTATAALTP